MSLSILPPELLRHIFSFLRPESHIHPTFAFTNNDLYQCSLVCSTWRSNAFPFLFYHLDIRFDNRLFVKQLHFLSTFSSPDCATQAPHPYSPHIRTIHLNFHHNCLQLNLSCASSLALTLLRPLTPTQLVEVTIDCDERPCSCDASCLTACITQLASSLRRLQSCHITYCSFGTLMSVLDPVFAALPEQSLQEISIRYLSRTHKRNPPPIPSSPDQYPDLARLRNIHAASFIGLRWPPEVLACALRVWGEGLRDLSVVASPGLVEPVVLEALRDACPSLEPTDIDSSSGHLTGVMRRNRVSVSC
ncbi:hypothetical protein BC936DRAFT_138560 [Jimgerdemannia flammicorona]|uniref:F-box domain-containing protein n=1 Tax=Jimgerdemannia flammicorona TaxID=994334 RepID=A0A433C4A4_9FUNG|nr:hypothetical protein BC936DRAFT_138560 [Jimgerdemannia flammicorona]